MPLFPWPGVAIAAQLSPSCPYRALPRRVVLSVVSDRSGCHSAAEIIKASVIKAYQQGRDLTLVISSIAPVDGHIRSNSPPIPEAPLKTAKANVKDGSGEVFRYGP
jgi:hypothetical protein